MKGIRQLRRQHLRKTLSALGMPVRRRSMVAHTRQISYAELVKLPVEAIESPQNDDGTFKFLLGYDDFGGDVSL